MRPVEWKKTIYRDMRHKLIRLAKGGEKWGSGRLFCFARSDDKKRIRRCVCGGESLMRSWDFSQQTRTAYTFTGFEKDCYASIEFQDLGIWLSLLFYKAHKSDET